MQKLKKQLTVERILCIIQVKHRKSVPVSSNLSHFQSIHGGGFFRKGETYEQTTRLSSYVRANSTTDGGQAKNFFAVVQQQRIR